MHKLSNSTTETVAVILAAGMGTRMKSSKPKAMHPIAGLPMIRLLLNQVEKVFDRIIVVLGPHMETLADLVKPHQVVIQKHRLGTAHAALQAEAYFGKGIVTVLNADNPLIRENTLQRLIDEKKKPKTDLVLLAMECNDPKAYGRVIENNGHVIKIVETLDASDAEKKIKLCNSGVICADALYFSKWLKEIENHNAKKEYYIIDIVSLAVREHNVVKALRASETELTGINSQSELAFAESIIQKRLRKQAMDNGVTMISPETVFMSYDTKIENDVILHPNIVFGKNVIIRSGVEIKSFSHLEGCEIKQNAIIGPYARIRPDTVVGQDAHVGNFVELKATALGDGAKANHLSYLGDSIVGKKTNIGAGTITCNYDGSRKHKTVIGDEVFVGSDAILVAPVEIGNKSLIAAGSVITDDVPDNAKAFGRARQINKNSKVTLKN
ncbi:bifunctional UDP-N-acetylglucosamine diphosphorylase/glucosamine-1-phosphate N-acetyltransferase GlmU [Commensalibacter sp. M0134]|uniref:bifunctional UDP-N-acetylglucosamine diphosphorylase/glucosamine-1-phosphate N-acetyltransferase GlmU n=1 Tax=Commensalibacter TaxID=1079922 RepID=UPI0018DCBFD9|nr:MULTISPECIES: bifunctional UDP-N-acetylglucosamine diphosphorylase/glucosamine-1-phosphate N-acetyltransferase GlmU [Commensalibacter]MBI0065439.1 bifunctional UDP-N-acetylglucosamine diphosphorylase/glucosamine-1-phosphate N-acetyltransferase GlmU [Commensalibacter sp. M0134]MBI0069322.1 bifunctional UDP-N-acetylglucosamine diphosphorylase/glucosamine-1-phosphate N-acetyltransferase GlmU [Commensalibacter sp. M0133]MBI0081075.1 bifunctional UDP-N-acetylglucosamine diphosphorylase/glucosamine